ESLDCFGLLQHCNARLTELFADICGQVRRGKKPEPDVPGGIRYSNFFQCRNVGIGRISLSSGTCPDSHAVRQGDKPLAVVDVPAKQGGVDGTYAHKRDMEAGHTNRAFEARYTQLYDAADSGGPVSGLARVGLHMLNEFQSIFYRQLGAT